LNRPDSPDGGFIRKMNNLPNHTKRFDPRRFFFILSGLLLIGGIVAGNSSGFTVWSRSFHQGGIFSLAGTDGTLVAAKFYRDQVQVLARDKLTALNWPKPARVVAGDGVFYVIGLLNNKVACLTPNGNLRAETEFPANYVITALLPDRKGTWVAGYRKRRIDDRPKEHFFLPEYSRFEWFVEFHERGLPAGPVRFSHAARRFDQQAWHEESGGFWRLLEQGGQLYLINDQAETITCLDKERGRIIWQAATPPRPTGAVIWGDRLLVCSAQGGVLAAYRLDNGGTIWNKALGRGLADLALFQNKIAISDMIHDRLLLVDPLNGMVVNELGLAGGPHALLSDGDRLAVGLDIADEVVWLDSTLREVQTKSLNPGDTP